MIITTHSPEETLLLGETLARHARGGDVIAYRGGLGAGKTTLTRGIARGLGIEETLTSPTYTIISVYPGRLPLYHMDLYRLSGDEEFEMLGTDDFLGYEGLTVIEWSEKAEESLPPEEERITITIDLLGDETRRFTLEGDVPESLEKELKP